MADKLLYWLVTGVAGISLFFVFFAIKTWVSGINEKFTLLFAKLDTYIEKLSTTAKSEDLRVLEKRVRNIEDKMNRCSNCK
jgi:hypothetical protein